MIKRFIWPEACVVECSKRPIGVWKRLNLAWSCLFTDGVRGLCLEAPDWARDKGE